MSDSALLSCIMSPLSLRLISPAYCCKNHLHLFILLTFIRLTMGIDFSYSESSDTPVVSPKLSAKVLVTLTAVRHHPSPETLLVHSEMLELSFSIAQAQHLDVSFINLHRIWNFTLLVQIPATALTALPTSHHQVGSNLELSKVIV